MFAKSKRNLDQRGVTLLETMLALLIFSIGIMAVGAMQVSSLRLNTQARRSSLDSAVAADFLEQFLSLPYDDPLLVDSDNGFEPSAFDHGPFQIESTDSEIEWEVEDQSSVNGIKRIRVTIRSSDAGGVLRTRTYEYVKARGALK